MWKDIQCVSYQKKRIVFQWQVYIIRHNIGSMLAIIVKKNSLNETELNDYLVKGQMRVRLNDAQHKSCIYDVI